MGKRRPHQHQQQQQQQQQKQKQQQQQWQQKLLFKMSNLLCLGKDRKKEPVALNFRRFLKMLLQLLIEEPPTRHRSTSAPPHTLRGTKFSLLLGLL